MSKSKISPELIYANNVLVDSFSKVFMNNKTIFIDGGNGVLIEVYKHNNESFRVETYSNGVNDGNQFCLFKDILLTVRDVISRAEPNDKSVNSHVGGTASVYVYSDLKDHYKKNVHLFHGIIKFSFNGVSFIISPLDDLCSGKDTFTVEAFGYTGLLSSSRVAKEDVLARVIDIAGPYGGGKSVEGLTGVRIQHLVKGETVDEIFVGSKNKQVQFKQISDQLIKEFF